MKGEGQRGPVVIGVLGAVTPKLEVWLQQIPGTTTEPLPGLEDLKLRIPLTGVRRAS